MKKHLHFLLIALMLCVSSFISAQGGINQNFASLGNWFVDDKPNGTSSVSGGHLIVTMGDQGNGKYRADLKNDNATYTINSTTDKIIAVKFIGDKPATGAFKVELRNETAGAWMNNGGGKYNPTGSITTAKGNLIYYFDFSGDANYTTGDISISRIGFTIADVVDPTNYTIDWVASFIDVTALEAYKDTMDDGASDDDETLGVNDVLVKNKTLKLYPNPSVNNSFNINLETGFLKETTEVKVYSIIGELVLQKQLKTNSKLTTINHNLKSGMYLVMIENRTAKLIVE
ncbi:T9SS type A sorting domain-containing protein [Thalassobellus sediminis]|uniref:T9SS type A sorting domain-containing protein n=1 Tax=Thalassobellus sediminis TaxID=3367753 RepID=UPI0037B9C1BB